MATSGQAANIEPATDHPGLFSRIYRALFGYSDPSLPQNYANPQSASGIPSYIQNATVVQGNGSDGSSSGNSHPIHIQNLHGSVDDQMSEAARLALERERTKQIELANEVTMQMANSKI